MRAVYALLLAGLSCASPIFSTEKVDLNAVQAGADKMVEVDLTESTVNDDGLVIKTAVSFNVEVAKGVAIINDQYMMPVGVSKFTVQTTVSEYELMPSGLRMATPKEQEPVALSVAAHVEFDFQGHLHLQLQVIEAEGKDLSEQHYSAVELVLDENMNEQARIIMATAKPIAPEDIEQAEDVVPTSGEDSVSDSTELEVKKNKCKIFKWYNSQPVEVRVGVSVGGAAAFALVSVLLFKCCRLCCAPKKKGPRPPPKGKFYARNIQAANNKRAFIPIKQYKYQKVAVAV